MALGYIQLCAFAVLSEGRPLTPELIASCANSTGIKARFSSQAQRLPDLIHPGRDLWRHLHRPPPFAAGLARPLVGGVDAHLAAQAADGRGKVEVVDRRAVHQQGVA